MPRTLEEARTSGARRVFLCHSHFDVDLVKGLLTLLSESGWNAYIDWMDVEMPDAPNRETALRLQNRIIESDIFLFLATQNSMASRWCPWEIGFANGKKHMDSIIVCRTQVGNLTHGNEYLDLYRRLDFSNENRLAVWFPGMHRGGVRVPRL